MGISSPPPTFAEEVALRSHGYHLIAGIDEAGRGPLAGPVVAGAAMAMSSVSVVSNALLLKRWKPEDRA